MAKVFSKFDPQLMGVHSSIKVECESVGMTVRALCMRFNKTTLHTTNKSQMNGTMLEWM